MKIPFVFCGLFLLAIKTDACSTFLLSRDGHHVFGRNYDWVTGNGMVVVNARGVAKTSMVGEDEKPVSWTSKWGSVSFNQFGKEFPHGGMNEKGLVVELMWLEGTVYPKEDSRGALNELQWIQYQLDNASTVQEVLASNQIIRINQRRSVPLHFLVADAMGNAATVEFIKGEMVVHQGSSLAYPVLTNTPYMEALSQAKDKSNSDNSVQRFAKACTMVQQFQELKIKTDPVEYAFSILNTVAQGDFTKWKIVYDITNRRIYFSTTGNRKQLALKDFDFTCAAPSLFLPINSKKEGNVRPYFAKLDYDTNKNMLQQSATESKTYVNVSDETVARGAAYFRQVACVQ